METVVRNFIYSMCVVAPKDNHAIIDYIQQNLDGATHITEDGEYVAVQAWLDAGQYKENYVKALNKEGPFEGCYTTFKSTENWRETHDEHRDATLAHVKKGLAG